MYKRQDLTWGPSRGSGHDVVYNSLFESGDTGGDFSSNPSLWPEYYNAVREIRDLLWQEEEISKVIDHYADLIAPLVEADYMRWRDAPAEAGNYSQLSGPGMISLDAYVADMKAFAFTGGSWPGGDASLSTDANDEGLSGTQGRDAWLDLYQGANGEADLIPDTPSLVYVGPANFPVDAITLEASAFSDPQGDQSFGAMEWRLARDGDPVELEIDALWESGELVGSQRVITIPSVILHSGASYRARVRQRDDSGRWSHWSAPLNFTTSAADLSQFSESLVISEVMYLPSHPSPSELAAGFTLSLIHI